MKSLKFFYIHCLKLALLVGLLTSLRFLSQLIAQTKFLKVRRGFKLMLFQNKISAAIKIILMVIFMLPNISFAQVGGPAPVYKERSVENEKVASSDVVFTLASQRNLMSKDDLDTLYENFTTFFNDLETTVGEGEAGQRSALDEDGNLVIRREVQPREGDYSDFKSLTTHFGKQNWDDLMDVLTLTCSGGDRSQGRPEQLYQTEQRYFESLEQQEKKFQALSTLEIPFTESMARLFIDLYKRTRKARSQEFCDEFDRLKTHYTEATGVNLQDAAPNSIALQNVLFKYEQFARIIAHHQAYALFLRYYHLTSAAFQGFRQDQVSHRDFVLQEIVRFPGADTSTYNDLYTKRLGTSQEITKLLQSIYNEKNKHENSYIGERRKE